MSRNRRIYIGKLAQRTRERDIEDAFSKYGKINAVDLKRGYAFVEYDDERDADDAIRAMDGNELDGARIVVEASHGGRDRRGPGSDECFSCGGRGHWARDCPSSRGGSRRGGGGSGGSSRYRSRSRSPRRGGGGGGDRYNSRRSRSRSPSPRKGRDSRSRSPAGDRAPRTDDRDNRDRDRDRSRSPAPAKERSQSPKRDRAASASPARKENGNDKSKSPAQDE